MCCTYIGSLQSVYTVSRNIRHNGSENPHIRIKAQNRFKTRVSHSPPITCTLFCGRMKCSERLRTWIMRYTLGPYLCTTGRDNRSLTLTLPDRSCYGITCTACEMARAQSIYTCSGVAKNGQTGQFRRCKISMGCRTCQSCWRNYRKTGTHLNTKGIRVNTCVPNAKQAGKTRHARRTKGG